MVGEPVAYATGSPELKAIGPSRTVSNSPITKSKRGFVCGGAPQTLPAGRVRVVRERPETSLESRAVAAHRAYVEALAALERAVHIANCPTCQPDGTTDREHALRCASAEAEKERRRVLFRDLCDKLGYVPVGHGIALPSAHCPSRSRAG